MTILNLGLPLTYSNAVNASFPSYPIDVLTSASGAWADDASTLPVSRAKAHQVESTFGVGYTAWLGSSGNTRTITCDLGTAMAPDRLIMKGYYGSDSIFRPLASVVEWSDDNSAWNTVQSLTGLTAGGAPGARQWWIGVDTSGAGSHQYWRATLTLGGSFLFLSTFELHADLINIAEGRPYTVSPAANANFPDNFTLTTIYPGDSDFSTTAGKLTNGEHGYPGLFGSGVGWQLATTAVGTVRVDLGSAQAGDHVAIHGINGNGSEMVTPGTLALEWSDDDSAWTSVHSQSGLTVVQNNKGRWIYRVDISGETAHRYWRVQATNGHANTRFITLTQFEFWQSQGGEPVTIDTEAARLRLRSGDTSLELGATTIQTEAARLRLRSGETSVAAGAVTVDTVAGRVRVRSGETSVATGTTIDTAAGRIRLRSGETTITLGAVVIDTSAGHIRLRSADTDVVVGGIAIDTSAGHIHIRSGVTSVLSGQQFIPAVECSLVTLPVACEVTTLPVACDVFSVGVDCELVDAYGQGH